MSSEQAGGDMHPGAVLFETLTGEVPHAGPTVQAVIAKVTTIEKRSATAVRPSQPAHIAASVGRALDCAPGSRFARRGRIHRGTRHATRR